MATLGQNISFQIYNADGTPFDGLVLRKSTSDSVVMALGDKITGDVYYNGNLSLTMLEYIVVKNNPSDQSEEGVKYVLVSPPTIVREGMVSENSQLNGMTKYSFVFYHPMYMLSNFPFTDVAVTNDQRLYLSESKVFSWIGYPDDFIAKLNKNLVGTEWVVVKSSNFPADISNQLSEVIPFENASIADALKTGYDTWGTPYVTGLVLPTDAEYASGKRFKVVFGLPSDEIYEDAAHKQAGIPFVFQFGSGVGLKNNSRTPRNNKIVTRIAGYGSERNIPYGYPQIIWYGDQRWDYTEYEGDTINYNADGVVTNTPKSTAYPIYKGIVGGTYVKLIKHPFTRKTLMPKVYTETLFNKVSPYAEREIIPTPDYTITLTDELARIDNVISEVSGSFKAIMQTLRAALVEVATHTSHYTVRFNTENGDGAVFMDDKLLMNGCAMEAGGGREFEFEEVYNDTHIQPILPNQNYNPNLRLIDFYDAVPSEEYPYPNPIVQTAPSYESHEFEDIYPELGEAEIVGVLPYDSSEYVTFVEFNAKISKLSAQSSNNAEKTALAALLTDVISSSGQDFDRSGHTDGYTYSYSGRYHTYGGGYWYGIKYESTGVNLTTNLYNGTYNPADDVVWDDTMDDEGNYVQSYFKIKLPVLSFDLYACASITEEMFINMRGGACLGCTFPVQVDWDDYKSNFFDADGNFVPYGLQRNFDKYPDSSQQQIEVIVQKEYTTFGTLMPNVYQQPVAGDEFVVLGISLPLSYIRDAEERLEDESKAYMLENNVHYFDYPLKFDEHFLSTHQNILSQLKTNSIVRFNYNGTEQELYVKQLTIKYGESVLPKYDITLTDNIEVVLNQIGQAVDGVEKLGSLVNALRREYSDGAIADIAKKLSRVQDDTAQGLIRFVKGIDVGSQFVSGLLGSGGCFHREADGTTYLEADKMYIRMKAYFDTVEIREYQHSAGNRVASVAGAKCCRVEWIKIDNGTEVVMEQNQANLAGVEFFRCYFRASDGEDTTRNDFVIGDQVYCHITSIDGASDNPNAKGLNQKHYWRLCIGRNSDSNLTADGEAWVDISNRVSETLTIGGTQYTHAGYQTGSDVPAPQDSMIQLGNINDTTRQGAIMENVTGANAPSYSIYQGINDFNLVDKNYIIICYNTTTGHADMKVYGDAYIGDRNGSTFVKYEQENQTTHAPKLTIKAEIDIQSTFGGESLQQRVVEYAPPYDDEEIKAMIADVQKQIDGTIDTWFYDYMPVAKDQTGAPSGTTPLIWLDNAHTIPCYPYYDWYTADHGGTAQETITERAKHLSDIFYDNKTGYAFRFVNTEPDPELTPVFAWVEITDSAVIKALADAAHAQDTADHKSTIFLNNPEDQDTSKRYPTNYKKGDSWVLPSGSGEVNISNTGTERKFKKGSIITATADMVSSYNPLDWEEKVRYTDDTYAHGFDYISSNLARLSSTQIAGGLVLSSLIGLRDSNQNIQSGISGIIDSTQGGKKGGGIAAWFGGEQGDKEDQNNYSGITRWAKSILRFDGSGYLANGNITWDATGKVTIKDLHTDDGNLSVDVLQEMTSFRSMFDLSLWQSTSRISPLQNFDKVKITHSNGYTFTDNDVLNRVENDARYMVAQRFFDLFDVYNGSTNYTNTYKTSGLPSDTSNISIKAKFGLWTERYLSALGLNDNGGSSSVGVLNDLLDVTITSPSNGQILKYNGSAWVNAAAPATGVTSVGLSMPTGFSVANSPVTSSGAFSVTFASGYSLPTTAKQSNWDTAYGWGNHASAGYALSSALGNYLPLSGGTLTDALIIHATTHYNNYDEGIRIQDAPNNWAGITFGATGSTGCSPQSGEVAWFLAKRPGGQFIISPDTRDNTVGITLNKNGDALWRNQTIIHSGNIGSQSVSYATSAGTLSGMSRNASSNWSGTGLSMLMGMSDSWGGDCLFLTNQSGQMSFCVDGCFYQRLDNTGVSRRVLDEYDRDNTTWSNADTLDSLHASAFHRYYADSSLNANDAAVGWHDVANTIVNAAHSNHSTLIYVNNVGTPYQLQIPDSSEPYIYKRYYGGGWRSWFKISAGYADSAGSAPASDVYSWAKQPNKPSYHAGELDVTPTSYKAGGWASAGILPYISDMGTNIFSGASVGEITVERSYDDGATWSDVTTSEADAVKAVFSGCITGTLFVSGRNHAQVGDRLRITFNPYGSSRYCQLAFIYVYFSTSGCGCYCDVEKNWYTDTSHWYSYTTDAQMSGWSGPNIIGMGGTIFGQGDSRNDGYGIRMTFRITSVSSDYDSRGYIFSIQGFTANRAWGVPDGNSIARSNTPYSFVNADRGVRFDNSVAAASYGLFGGTSGVYIGATYAGGSNGYDCIERAGYGNMLYMQYYSNGGINMCQGGGNVGIGTTSPSYKLDVNGTGYFTSYVGINGSINSNYALYVNGKTFINEELHVSHWNFLRSVHGNYGIMFRNDGADFYILLTDSGNQYGSWNSLRPFRITLSTGLLETTTLCATSGMYSLGYVSALGQNTSSDARKKDIIETKELSLLDIANAPSVKYLWKHNRELGMQVGSIAQYWQKILPEAVHEDNDGYLSMEYGVIALLASISTARKVQDHERRIAQLEKENERLRTELEQIKLA